MTVQQHIAGGAVLKREPSNSIVRRTTRIQVLRALPRYICEQPKSKKPSEVPPEAHLPPAEALFLSLADVTLL